MEINLFICHIHDLLHNFGSFLFDMHFSSFMDNSLIISHQYSIILLIGRGLWLAYQTP
jgi:hypothetical protein